MREHIKNNYSKINLEIVIDPYIHDQAKISRETFSNRISNVKGIRTKEFSLGFYLNDISKLSKFEQLHQIVNSGKFIGQTFTSNKLFAIGIPQKLFHWLRNITPTTLHKQLLHWHAAYYAFNSFQEFAEEELAPLVLKEVKKIVNQFYPENYKEKFCVDNIENSRKYKAIKEYGLKYYYEKSEQYTGSLPPEFLKNPYRDPLSSIEDSDLDWGLLPDCRFSLLISYFNELDWIIIAERSKPKLIEFHKWSIDNKRMSLKEVDDIIENADNDTLQRAESDSDMWQKWKYTFQNFEIRKEYTYSLVPKDDLHSGYVYLQQDETLATKIGWTKNEGFQRKAGNQTGNPTKLTERGRFKASSRKTETVLHELFKDKLARQGGEWFWLTENDIENILNHEWRMKNNIF